MNVRWVETPTASLECDWLCLGLHDNAPIPDCLRDTPIGLRIQRLIDAKELGRSLGETTVLFEPEGLGAKALLLVGLGTTELFGPDAAFAAGFAAMKRAAGRPRAILGVYLPSGNHASQAFLEGLLGAAQGPDLRKSEPKRQKIEEVQVVGDPSNRPADTVAWLRRVQITAEAVLLARELTNTPPGEKTPRLLAERFEMLGSQAGLAVEIWDFDRIQAERFGGLLGVSAGSEEPPRFVKLGWNPKSRASAEVAIVGKGVTFDSGGLSLKPSASMEDMKADMTGAAVAFSVLWAIARLGINVAAQAFIPLTENMTGGRAMKLGDVLRMRNGKTVEVMNTDAEGRLILADALAYAAENRPDRMIDLATLTGACMVALGPKVAGLFSNHDTWTGEFEQARVETGERVWRLPLDSDYMDQLKSPIADLKNVGSRWGGAITAAKFLEQFVDGTPWIHLDIAGPSWADSDSSTQDAGGTGCFVRTLVRLLEAKGQEAS